ncbi:MAG: hypothetical protein U9Q74_16210 [Gemmatimonadota bacterium]|nr:hypothetical protein [Gemmatimonadota bacterium]
MAARDVISRERAERIAKAHACEHCGEYSYKKLSVKPPSASQRRELNEAWHAIKTCGVCGLEQEMGIAADGEIIYVS